MAQTLEDTEVTLLQSGLVLKWDRGLGTGQYAGNVHVTGTKYYVSLSTNAHVTYDCCWLVAATCVSSCFIQVIFPAIPDTV